MISYPKNDKYARKPRGTQGLGMGVRAAVPFKHLTVPVMAEETVEERRERLRALRAAAELSAAATDGDGNADGKQAEVAADEGDGRRPEEHEEHDDEGPQEPQEQPELPGIRFRNYLPRDEELQKLKREPPVLPKFDDLVATEAAKAEDPIVSIAPKKANWDLRRDVAKKLEKLEKRTQRAIIELMPEEKENRKVLGLEQEY